MAYKELKLVSGIDCIVEFLRLLPRLLVTSIRPFIGPSITSFRRQFIHKI
jgi:hypothetical protein